MEINSGELIAIIGPVGAGKSSFLMSLLEELEIIGGDVKINGSVFYVPQEPWIFDASIRQNILFGLPYNEKKFNEVIELACLEQVRLVNIFKLKLKIY
jgi:ATP-binding cassette subfamily C (CFTR/MRP) protein 4